MSIYRTITCLLLTAALPLAAQITPTAEVLPAAATPEEILSNGTPMFDARLRYESGEQSNLKDANALTLGTRLGFRTATYDGFLALLEAGNTAALNHENDYSAGGTNPGGAGRVSFPDEPVTYVNQAWLGYHDAAADVRVGRQRLNLDNVRFVGDVSWWQKMQTYDSATVLFRPAADWTAFYGYVWHVSRVYGNESPQPDWQSKSHLIKVAYRGWSYGTFTAYGYLLDFTNSAANSSDTYGGSFVGAAPVTPQIKLTYRAEAARQENAGNNPLNYSAAYYHGSLGAAAQGYELSADYEILGSDDGKKGFATPLATLHGFNGWANEFTATPANGLRDFYVTGVAPLPAALALKVMYHWFKSDFGDLDYGREFDAMLTYKLGKHWTVLGEAGRYRRGLIGPYFDTNKYWLQTEFSY